MLPNTKRGFLCRASLTTSALSRVLVLWLFSNFCSLSTLLPHAVAFSSPRSGSIRRGIHSPTALHRNVFPPPWKLPSHTVCLARIDSPIPSNNDDTDDGDSIEEEGLQVIRRGTEDDEFSEEFWEEIEAGQPSEWSVLKEVSSLLLSLSPTKRVKFD